MALRENYLVVERAKQEPLFAAEWEKKEAVKVAAKLKKFKMPKGKKK